MNKIGNNVNTNIGRQLSRRVRQGDITSEQANRTARQRVTLALIYGPDWRTKVFGEGGARALGAPKAKAKRTKALQRATTILNGNGGTEAKGKRYLNG
ncbi:MAG: hypothetical protein ACRDPE_23460 [Solirubrobacterales bacterium]